MSKTFICSAVCREFESEAPATEEMLQKCSVDLMVAELYATGDREFQTADAVIMNAFGLKVLVAFRCCYYIHALNI